jgi:hypothetical protein
MTPLNVLFWLTPEWAHVIVWAVTKYLLVRTVDARLYWEKRVKIR